MKYAHQYKVQRPSDILQTVLYIILLVIKSFSAYFCKERINSKSARLLLPSKPSAHKFSCSSSFRHFMNTNSSSSKSFLPSKYCAVQPSTPCSATK